MASEAQIAANRRNAQCSTGPRSAAGKATVAQNAIRHGLAGPVLLQGSAGQRMQQLADAFLGDGPRTNATEEAALQAAEAQFIIEQTRLVRLQLFDQTDPAPRPVVSVGTRRARKRAQRLVAKVPTDVMGEDRKQRFLGFFAQQEALDSPIQVQTNDERQAAVLDEAAVRLLRLDRYERRALSRRRRALADLAELQRAEGEGAAKGEGGAA